MATQAMIVSLILDCDDSGWSETYPLTYSSSANYNDIGRGLAAKRAEILGVGAKIVGVRYHTDDNPKDVTHLGLIYLGRARTGTALIKNADLQADNPYSCVLLPYKTAAGTRRYVTLSGFPDDMVTREINKNADLTQDGRKQVAVFYDYLKGVAPVLMIRERTHVGETAPKKILGVDVDADGRYVFQHEGGMGLTLGNKVVLTKLKGNAVDDARGTRKVVLVNDATHFTIDRGPRSDKGTPKIIGQAYASKVGYTYSTANGVKDDFLVSSRKRGRPYAARRGRRTASR